jgi:heptosyltransferase-3
LALIDALRVRGLRVVLTGGPAGDERAFCRALAAERDGVTNIAGDRSFGQLALLLEGAACYIGPDTSVTHLAAACGTPTVALYGPTNPVKWGPWPAGYAQDRNPYVNKSPLQHVNNVWLVQPEGDCVPCHGEGCDKHKDSDSDCLLSLPAPIVIAAADQALAWGSQRANTDTPAPH